jgi:hypothetical protein
MSGPAEAKKTFSDPIVPLKQRTSSCGWPVRLVDVKEGGGEVRRCDLAIRIDA